jgi:hypothetical protein
MNLEMINAMKDVKNFFADTAFLSNKSDFNDDEHDHTKSELEQLARSTPRSRAKTFADVVKNWALTKQESAPITTERIRCMTEATALSDFLSECDASGILDGKPSPFPFGSQRIATLAVKHGKIIDRTHYLNAYDYDGLDFGATHHWFLQSHSYVPVMRGTEATAYFSTNHDELYAELKTLRKEARDAIDTPEADVAFEKYKTARNKWNTHAPIQCQRE